MKLSMHIIEKWFKDRGYQTKSSIVIGEMKLTGARITNTYSNDSSAHITTESDRFGLISIFNGRDIIFVSDCDCEKVLNETNAAFEFYNSWEATLLRSAFQRFDIQELLDQATLAIRRPMLIKNSRPEICAITRSYGPGVHPNWAEYLKYADNLPIRIDDYDTGHGFNYQEYLASPVKPTIATSPISGSEFAFANLFFNDHRVGFISVYKYGTELNECDLQLLGVFQGILNFYIAANPDALFGPSVVDKYMVSKLDPGQRIHVTLEDVYKATDWEEDNTYLLMAIRPIDKKDSSSVINLIESIIAKVTSVYYANINTDCVVLFNATKGIGFKELAELMPKVANPAQFRWSIGYTFSDLETISEQYEPLRRCLDYAEKYNLSEVNLVFTASNIILQNISYTPEVKKMFHPAYLQMRAYDEEHHTPYTEALFWYLFYNKNLPNAAEQLGVHRNTLNNWITKIAKMIPLSVFDTASSRLLYILSLSLDHIWN